MRITPEQAAQAVTRWIVQADPDEVAAVFQSTFGVVSEAKITDSGEEIIVDPVAGFSDEDLVKEMEMYFVFPFRRTYRNLLRDSCLLPASQKPVSMWREPHPELVPPQAFSVSAELAATFTAKPWWSWGPRLGFRLGPDGRDRRSRHPSDFTRERLHSLNLIPDCQGATREILPRTSQNQTSKWISVDSTATVRNPPERARQERVLHLHHPGGTGEDPGSCPRMPPPPAAWRPLRTHLSRSRLQGAGRVGRQERSHRLSRGLQHHRIGMNNGKTRRTTDDSP